MDKEVKLIENRIDLQVALAIFRSGYSLPIAGNAVGILNITLSEENALLESDLHEVFNTVIPINFGTDFHYQVSRVKKEYMDAFSRCLDKKIINKWVVYFCTGVPSSTAETTEDVKLQYHKSTNQTLDNDPQWNRFVDFLKAAARQQEGMYALSIPGFTLEEIYSDKYIPILTENFSSVTVSTIAIECMNDVRYLRELKLRL